MSVIEKKAELETYFHDAGKSQERWRVGTEYEKVGIDRRTAEAIPYFGRRGVEFILRELSASAGNRKNKRAISSP
jgi:gamma-glutamylcysteine synthetase